jgi:hypothetical protein
MVFLDSGVTPARQSRRRRSPLLDGLVIFNGVGLRGPERLLTSAGGVAVWRNSCDVAGLLQSREHEGDGQGEVVRGKAKGVTIREEGLGTFSFKLDGGAKPARSERSSGGPRVQFFCEKERSRSGGIYRGISWPRGKEI